MLRANHSSQHFWDFPEQGYAGAPDIPNPLLCLQGVLFNSYPGCVDGLWTMPVMCGLPNALIAMCVCAFQ